MTDTVPVLQRSNGPCCLPCQVHSWKLAVVGQNVFRVRQETVMRLNLQVAPGRRTFRIDHVLQSDLDEPGIRVHEYLDAARIQCVGHVTSTRDVEINVGSACHLVKAVLAHAETISVQQTIVPTAGERGFIALEKIFDEANIERAVFAEFLTDWIVRPGIGVLVVIDVVTQLMKSEYIVEIVPCDASERVLPDQAANNDS